MLLAQQPPHHIPQSPPAAPSSRRESLTQVNGGLPKPQPAKHTSASSSDESSSTLQSGRSSQVSPSEGANLTSATTPAEPADQDGDNLSNSPDVNPIFRLSSTGKEFHVLHADDQRVLIVQGQPSKGGISGWDVRRGSGGSASFLAPANGHGEAQLVEVEKVAPTTPGGVEIDREAYVLTNSTRDVIRQKIHDNLGKGRPEANGDGNGLFGRGRKVEERSQKESEDVLAALNKRPEGQTKPGENPSRPDGTLAREDREALAVRVNDTVSAVDGNRAEGAEAVPATASAAAGLRVDAGLSTNGNPSTDEALSDSPTQAEHPKANDPPPASPVLARSSVDASPARPSASLISRLSTASVGATSTSPRRSISGVTDRRSTSSTRSRTGSRDSGHILAVVPAGSSIGAGEPSTSTHVASSSSSSSLAPPSSRISSVRRSNTTLGHPQSAHPFRRPPQRNNTFTGRSDGAAAAMIPSTSTGTGMGTPGAPALDPNDDFDQSRIKRASEIRMARQKREEAHAEQEREDAEARVAVANQKEREKVLVGNLIGEGHVNYVLMYNMLTGIRIGVSRCLAKPDRALTDADYTARHKFSFDIIGNELTPSAKYDFKFKDYAPWVFRHLREYFHIDQADYLLSLTAKYILSELGSPGKSGSFFYFSRDYRFIIKTIRHAEHRFLRKILKDYHEHVTQNPHTLLSRFYGLHRVKLPHGRKIHFVIMNNLFPPHRDIHETYDLKGSSIGRLYPEEKAKTNPHAVLKDMNWLNRGRVLDLGPEKRALFEAQLERDTELLQRLGIMDYSLLIGIHDVTRGNKDKMRDGILSVFQPESQPDHKIRASALRKAVQSSDPKALSEKNRLPNQDRSERQHFIFYQDEGGLRATDELNRDETTIYYLGIIDILTPYSIIKRGEHYFRALQHDKHMISSVHPREYGDRFLDFLKSIIRGADISKRPKMQLE